MRMFDGFRVPDAATTGAESLHCLGFELIVLGKRRLSFLIQPHYNKIIISGTAMRDKNVRDNAACSCLRICDDLISAQKSLQHAPTTLHQTKPYGRSGFVKVFLYHFLVTLSLYKGDAQIEFANGLRESERFQMFDVDKQSKAAQVVLVRVGHVLIVCNHYNSFYPS